MLNSHHIKDLNSHHIKDTVLNKTGRDKEHFSVLLSNQG